MSEKLTIPNLGIFKNKNPYTGSRGDFNFCVVPMLEESILKSKVWYGKLNCANSKLTAEEDFSLDEDGYQKMTEWIQEQSHNVKQ